MRFDSKLVVGALAAATVPTAVNSLYADDAGVLDFTIATAGHGVTNVAWAYGSNVVTSDVPSSLDATTSCFVASRKIADGTLNWRRNVCSVPDETQQQHAVTVLGDSFFTVDNLGITRGWTMGEGNLMWDAQVVQSSNRDSNLWTFTRSGKDYVAVSSNAQLHILEAATGKHFDTVGASAGFKGKGEEARWLAILPDATLGADGPVRAIFAYVQEETGITSGNRMFIVEFEEGDDQVKSAKPLKHADFSMIASSLDFQMVGGALHAVAMTPGSESLVHFSLDNQSVGKNLVASSWNSQWSTVESVVTTSSSSMISVQGSDADANPAMSLYQYEGNTWSNVNADATFGAVSYCADIVVGLSSTGPQLHKLGGSSLTVSGDMFVPDGDVVASFQVLECSPESITTLLSTTRGTTTAISFTISGNSAVSKIQWTAEEGLASLSSAVLLDASHLGVDDLVEEEAVVTQKLQFSSRLSSQWESVVSLLSGGVLPDYSRRDHIFGFKKVAATISQNAHRMWGIDTSGDDRGTIRWSLDLPKDAVSHTMVHGTTNSLNSLHGINGGTHSREILVLSSSQSSVDWKCVDGTNGAVHAQGAVEIASPVLQVIPIYGSSGGCRQASLLLHQDLSLTVTPNDAETVALVQQQIKAAPNGFYTHLVDKASSALQAYLITESSGSFKTTQVGRTLFANEKVAKVSYPIRDEVVQTMCTILGDDSLLLKYINPHLAAVITVSEETNAAPTDLVAQIEKKDKKPRKPAGAGDAATVEAASTEPSTPNMFVNLVDTVSGRVVHRASHYTVDPASNFAVVVSENWVLYSFVNSKTRRTELGVLTLHEGMIESKGLTMFTSPDQATSFSSLDARTSKPVVLSKTYAFPKSITALGTTATRGGISSRKILVASADGRITSVDRAMLETRRPVGEVKEAEKKEGLFPYKELIPEVSLMAINYNQTVELVQSIVSTPTSLESQSLLFAFGGPDIFFTRTSPSRGFDLLPDSFSKLLVSIVTVGLVVVLFVVKRMGSAKVVKQGWM